MNLLDRLKAGIVDDASESAALISDADDWVGKALAAKRSMQNNPPVRLQLDVNGPPPGPPALDAITASAPPPPPPPPPPPAPNGFMAGRGANERLGSYLQVTRADNVTARDLVKLLRDKGFHASAVPSSEDNGVRVIVGPYETPALERAKTELESAGFQATRVQ
jgi:hypothetical protein